MRQVEFSCTINNVPLTGIAQFDETVITAKMVQKVNNPQNANGGADAMKLIRKSVKRLIISGLGIDRPGDAIEELPARIIYALVVAILNELPPKEATDSEVHAAADKFIHDHAGLLKRLAES